MMIPLYTNWYTVLLHRFLGSFQDSDDSESVLRIAQRCGPVLNTINEVLALELQRLRRLYSWNEDVSKSHLNRIAVRTDLRYFGVVVVDPQLLGSLSIVENNHLV